MDKEHLQENLRRKVLNIYRFFAENGEKLNKIKKVMDKACSIFYNEASKYFKNAEKIFLVEIDNYIVGIDKEKGFSFFKKINEEEGDLSLFGKNLEVVDWQDLSLEQKILLLKLFFKYIEKMNERLENWKKEINDIAEQMKEIAGMEESKNEEEKEVNKTLKANIGLNAESPRVA
jgi:hypothetical protein